MKTNILLFILLSINLISKAQNCVVGNVTLATQADVDNFVTAHTAPNPTCDTIDGSLFIGGWGSSNINDISGLSFLTIINGSLTVVDTQLANVDGFSGITSIGNYLFIGSNAQLANVDGFSGVTSIGNFLGIQSNDQLANVDGFSGVTSIGSYLSIMSNDQLANVDGFSGLTSTGNYLSIQNNLGLIDIKGLGNLMYVDGDITVNTNTNLDECCILVNFMNGTNFIGGNLTVSGNKTNCANKKVIYLGCKISQQDTDKDGIIDSQDNCVNVANPNQLDTDGDGIGDVCDNCPDVANSTQLDTNNNGIGDACENATTGTDNGGVGIGTTDPKSQLEITQGDVFVKNKHRGIIMKSPSGKCFRYQPNEEGNLKAKEITCPDN